MTTSRFFSYFMIAALSAFIAGCGKKDSKSSSALCGVNVVCNNLTTGTVGQSVDVATTMAALNSAFAAKTEMEGFTNPTGFMFFNAGVSIRTTDLWIFDINTYSSTTSCDHYTVYPSTLTVASVKNDADCNAANNTATFGQYVKTSNTDLNTALSSGAILAVIRRAVSVPGFTAGMEAYSVIVGTQYNYVEYVLAPGLPHIMNPVRVLRPFSSSVKSLYVQGYPVQVQ